MKNDHAAPLMQAPSRRSPALPPPGIRRRFSLFAPALWLLMLFLAGTAPEAAARGTLTVGLSPDYPPLAFKQNDRLAGVEVDCARLLGEELGLPVKFVELPWDGLIPALLGGEVDILMSGLSITAGRKIRMAFTEPYLEVGQNALMRKSDAEAFPTLEAIQEAPLRIGVLRETTGDMLVQGHFTKARRVVYAKPEDAVWDLLPKRKKIDVFIYDAPAAAWYAAEHEAELVRLDTPFTREHLAWGLRRDNEELLQRVGDALRKTRQDGRLEQIINRWIPREP